MAHHKVKAAELGDAGKIQTLSQMLYARNEPIVLRVLDGTLRFFTKVKGKPILWVLSGILGRFLPTAEVVTIRQASEVVPAKCYGCGICVSTCASGARTMVNRQGCRNKYYPIDLVSSVFSGRQTSSIT